MTMANLHCSQTLLQAPCEVLCNADPCNPHNNLLRSILLRPSITYGG